MSLKIKSVREAYSQIPSVFVVSTNPNTIKKRPDDAIKEIVVEFDDRPEISGGKAKYVGYSHSGKKVFEIFTCAATVMYFTN